LVGEIGVLGEKRTSVPLWPPQMQYELP